MTVFGAEVAQFRKSLWPWADRDGRHLDVFVPLPFDRCLWLFYTRDPSDD